MNAAVLTAPAAPISRGRQWRLAVERLSIYAPVVLMGMLALGSYWLLRATPTTPESTPERAVAHDASDVMRRFSVRTYGPGGQLKTEVFGAEARRFSDDGSMEIDQARIRSFNPDGVLMTAKARRVWTNAGNEEYVLTGDAVVVREAATLPTGQRLDRLEFQGEHLHVFAKEQRVVSDQPVLLIRGNNQVRANQMDWSDKERVAHLTGQVRATLAGRPRP